MKGTTNHQDRSAAARRGGDYDPVNRKSPVMTAYESYLSGNHKPGRTGGKVGATDTVQQPSTSQPLAVRAAAMRQKARLQKRMLIQGNKS